MMHKARVTRPVEPVEGMDGVTEETVVPRRDDLVVDDELCEELDEVVAGSVPDVEGQKRWARPKTARHTAQRRRVGSFA